MRFRVKICGITRQEDAELAVALGADALGFIFHEKSPRYISPIGAKGIIDTLPDQIAKIGVMVSPFGDSASLSLHGLGLTAVQVHGNHQVVWDQLLPWHQLIPAFQVDQTFNESIFSTYRASCAAFLIDAKKEGQYGGTGLLSDWSKAKAAAKYGRVILAGGLHPENIEDALLAVQPYAIDLNSGLESKPGIKDHQLLEKAFQTIKELRGEDNLHIGPPAFPIS